MSLADDGPPTCPECQKVIAPTWSYCASCGANLVADLDHTDPDDLRRAYEDHDTIREAAERFDVGYATVRRAMIEHGIHDPERYSSRV